MNTSPSKFAARGSKFRRACWGLLAIVLAIGPGRINADTVKLKDGTVLEGNITAEDAATLSIYLEFAKGTIRQTRQINKADIAEIIRWTPEQRAQWQAKHDYEKLQRYRLDPQANYMVEYYDQVINNAFREFLIQYPDSPYASNVTAKIVAWQAERDLVVAGNVKLHGRWAPAAEAAPQIGRQRGHQLLDQARGLISEGRYESAIQLLQLVVHMDGQPDLVSQAKPLFDSACQQATILLNRQRQKLVSDVSSAEQRVEQARHALNEAEAPPQQATGAAHPQSLAQNQTAVSKAHSDLDAAETDLRLAKGRLDDVELRLETLYLQASAPLIVQAPKPQPATRPASSSSETLDTLADILAWVKSNWLAIGIIGLVLLFLLSRFVKD
ncbi:MAG TPA: hypothetical protein VL171_00955 [Verrucomicrobiae bacterium]|nr:hypothetical protein [Verrucomicrobiae bacterium]